VFVANCCELPQIATYAGFADPIFACNNVPKKKFPNAKSSHYNAVNGSNYFKVK